MTTITIDEMQKDLSTYLHRVAAGETLIVTEENRPLVEVKPVSKTATRLRPAGLCAGEFTVPNDFDEPLPEDVLQSFEGR